MIHESGNDGKPFFNTFSPEIRDTSQFNSLNQMLRRIENAVGLSYGTLSEVSEVEKTAEEVRSSKQRSFSCVKDIDYLGADDIEYTIDADQPVNPILKKYTSGSSLRQFPFIFASRESYGADTLQNIANSGFYEKLAAWVEKQSEEENLPELDEYRTPQYIEVLSSGYPFDTGDSTARYQITMNFVYTAVSEDMLAEAKRFADLAEQEYIKAGQRVGDGFIIGLDSKKVEISQLVGDIASLVSSVFNTALDIHSPSRVMAESGQYAAEGVAIGLETGAQGVFSASGDLASSLLSGFNTSNIYNRLATPSSFPSRYENYSSSSYASAPPSTQPLNTISPSFSIYIGDEEIKQFVVDTITSENANSGGWSV